jgi:glycosyltransferase involved in cell wall biosynthesis
MSSIDIAVPCYQYGRFLRDNIASVLDQGVANLRVLILDNASTDNSREIAEQLSKEDRRVSFVSHKRNIGRQANYNAAIEWATAEYFMILDADDLLSPQSLSRSVTFLDAHPNAVFAHGVEHRFSGMLPKLDAAVTARGEHWRIDSGVEFIRKVCRIGYNTIGWPTALRRTRAQKQIGYYRDNLTYADDMNMWLRLATLGDVAETDSVQGIRRLHPGQITEFYRNSAVNELIDHLDSFNNFYANEGARIPNATLERQRVVRKVASNGAKIAVKRVLRGDIKQAAKCFRFAANTLVSSQFTPRNSPAAQSVPLRHR